jgi:hypothetical protein
MVRGLAAFLCLVIAMLGFSSCGTQTRIETTWKIPMYTGKPFSKIAVIAVMKSRADNKTFELAAVSQLGKAGIEAVPAFSFFGPDTSLSQSELESRVKAQGADAVMIFKLIAVDKSRHYIPPTAYVVGEGPYLDWWDDPFWGYYTPFPYSYWGYWWPAYQVVTYPGYWVTDANYQVETALYRVSDSKLVWTSMSGTYDPKGDYDLGNSLTWTVIKLLKKDGLVKGAK